MSVITQRTYIGGDPGGAGAIAWSNRIGQFVSPMPETRRETIELIKQILSDADQPIAYIEKGSHYIPAAGASTMFTYGSNVERLGCILETLDVRLIEITPQKWQKVLNLGTSDRKTPPRMPPGMSPKAKAGWRAANFELLDSAANHNAQAKRDWKAKLKSEAERRFPHLKVTFKTCDALLIMEAAILIEGDKFQLV